MMTNYTCGRYITAIIFLYAVFAGYMEYISADEIEMVPASTFSTNPEDKSYMKLRERESQIYVTFHAEFDNVSVTDLTLWQKLEQFTISTFNQS